MTLLDLATRREDLRGRRFADADVDLPGRVWPSGANLAGTELVNPKFEGAELPAVILRDAELIGVVDFRAAKLHGAQLDGIRSAEKGLFTSVELPDAVLHGAQFPEANFDSADLKRVKGRQATFNGSYLHAVDLTGASLPRAAFRGVKMRGAQAARADLTAADFSGAELVGLRAPGADLSGAEFTKAVLTGAILDGVKLNESTDFSGADLRGASLREVALQQAILDGAELDVFTYQNSGWTPDLLAHLVVDKRARRPADLDKFPLEAQRLVDTHGSVLLLSFEGPVKSWHAHVFAGFAFACLGDDLASLSVEPLALEDRPSLWVTGLDSERLAQLATVFERLEWRTWTADDASPARRAMPQMLPPIEELRQRCAEIKLRTRTSTDGEARPRLWSRTALDALKTNAGPPREPWSRDNRIQSSMLAVGAIGVLVSVLAASKCGWCDGSPPSSAGSTTGTTP